MWNSRVLLWCFCLSASAQSIPVGLSFSTPSALPPGKFGVAYSTQLTVTGASIGTTPSFQIVNGSLPQGLQLSYTGLISGTPAASGYFGVEISCNDDSHLQVAAVFGLVITSDLKTSSDEIFLTTAVGPPSNLPMLLYGIQLPGGAAPFTFSVQSGGLPPGIHLNPDGSFSGAYTTAGQYVYTVAITDLTGIAILVPVKHTVEAVPLRIITRILPRIREGLPYRIPIEVAGGTPPYSFQLSGLCGTPSYNTDGFLSGTPQNCAPNFGREATVNINVSDSLGLSDFNYAVAIYDNPLVVPGDAFSIASQSYFLMGLPIPSGQPPFQWSAQLPDGVSLTPDTGVISGVVNEPGEISLPVTVTDGSGAVTTTTYKIQVTQSPFTITSSLPPAVPGQQYSAQLATNVPGNSNGWTIISVDQSSSALFSTYSVSSGGLLTAQIPIGTLPGDYLVYLSYGNLAAKTLHLTVLSPGVELGPQTIWSPQPVPVGKVHSQQLFAYGGTPPYRFGVDGAEAVLQGFTVNQAGLITWTPTSAGYFNFPIHVYDAAGTSDAKIYAFAAGEASMNSNSYLPGGVVGGRYSTRLLNSTNPPFSVSLLSGYLPPGLSINPATGNVEGVPGVSGLFGFRIAASTASETLFSPPSTFIVAIGANSAIQSVMLPAAVANKPFQTVLSSSVPQPLTWSIGPGSIPPGLTLNTSTGELSGTTSALGPWVFDVSASGGGKTTTTAVLLNVVASGGLTILPATIPVFTQPVTLQASGGVPPYQFSVISGSLGALQLDPSSGVLSGSVSAPLAFTVQAKDSEGNTGTITYHLNPPSMLVVAGSSTGQLPPATVGVPYSFQLSVSGGISPYSWLLDGTADLTISSTGLITGTPLNPGTINLSGSVVDSIGSGSGLLLSLSVNPGALQIPAQTLPPGRPGYYYEAALRVAGGVAPYTWTAVGGLPAGLSLTNWGVLTGTPADAATSSIMVQVKDSSGASAAQTIVLQVATGVPVISEGGVVNAGGYQSGGVTPGEIIDIFGVGLGPAAIVYNSPGPSGFGTTAGQTQVLFDGIPAPVIFASDKQVAAVVPFGLAGKLFTSLTVVNGAVSSFPIPLQVSDIQPAIFTADASGTGTGAIINQDGTRNSQDYPAAAGSIVTLFATGTGVFASPLTEGQLAPLQPPFAVPAQSLFAAIDELAADIAYQGVAPGEIAGLTQVNVVVPVGTAPGKRRLIVCQLLSGNIFPTCSQDGVVIYVR